MTTVTSRIPTEKEIRKLIDAYVDYKKAEDKFKKLKDELTSDLVTGKYESKYGNIIKNLITRNKLNLDKLKADYPDIDFDSYNETTQYISVTIQNMK